MAIKRRNVLMGAEFLAENTLNELIRYALKGKATTDYGSLDRTRITTQPDHTLNNLSGRDWYDTDYLLTNNTRRHNKITEVDIDYAPLYEPDISYETVEDNDFKEIVERYYGPSEDCFRTSRVDVGESRWRQNMASHTNKINYEVDTKFQLIPIDRLYKELEIKNRSSRWVRDDFKLKYEIKKQDLVKIDLWLINNMLYCPEQEITIGDLKLNPGEQLIRFLTSLLTQPGIKDFKGHSNIYQYNLDTLIITYLQSIAGEIDDQNIQLSTLQDIKKRLTRLKEDEDLAPFTRMVDLVKHGYIPKMNCEGDYKGELSLDSTGIIIQPELYNTMLNDFDMGLKSKAIYLNINQVYFKLDSDKSITDLEEEDISAIAKKLVQEFTTNKFASTERLGSSGDNLFTKFKAQLHNDIVTTLLTTMITMAKHATLLGYYMEIEDGGNVTDYFFSKINDVWTPLTTQFFTIKNLPTMILTAPRSIMSPLPYFNLTDIVEFSTLCPEPYSVSHYSTSIFSEISDIWDTCLVRPEYLEEYIGIRNYTKSLDELINEDISKEYLPKYSDFLVLEKKCLSAGIKAITTKDEEGVEIFSEERIENNFLKTQFLLRRLVQYFNECFNKPESNKEHLNDSNEVSFTSEDTDLYIGRYSTWRSSIIESLEGFDIGQSDT